MEKNIFILHSLNGDTLKIWGIDVKEKFNEKGINVIMPEFPIRAESKYERFESILTEYLDNGALNNNSIVIAHSIGNAYFIRFCEEKKFVPKSYIAVAPGAVYEYPSNRTDYIVEVKKQAYVKKEAFDYIKNLTCDKYCLYSDEDDNNKEKFTRFIDDTKSKGIYLKNYNHFDEYHNIYEVPELISLINELLYENYMKKLLLVIDAQKDFINENTKEYVNKIKELVLSDQFDDIAFTKFINDENSKWYKELNYKGCLDKKGQDIVISTEDYRVFEKTIYSSLTDELRNYIIDNSISKIYLCGFDTDACVQKTALDLFEENYDVYVLKDYCMSNAGVELHNVIINNLIRLIGKDRII